MLATFGLAWTIIGRYKAQVILRTTYLRCNIACSLQACGKGVNGSFHDKNGRPLVNPKTFPNMTSMCEKAHSLGLKCGFYMNNCICKEKMFTDPDMIDKIYRQSVQAMVDWGYDAVKLDGCSQFHNITYWAQLMNETGRPFEVENCHDSSTDPATISNFGDVCPFNWYRSSSDINPHWSKIWYNFQSTRQYATNPPLSRPGC